VSVTFDGIDRSDMREHTLSSGEVIAFPAPVVAEGWEMGLNLSNGRASALLGLLGLDSYDIYDGEVTLAEARRAVMRARATFSRAVHEHTSPVRESGGQMRTGTRLTFGKNAGVMSSLTRAPRVISTGISEDYLAGRLNDFADLVEAAAKAGATGIHWS